MFSSKFRRVMVAVALVAVAGVATAGGFHGHHRADLATPVVGGDLGEVVVYAPGDLGEVVVYAPHDLPEVRVSANREPLDVPVLADATDGAAGVAQLAAAGL
jgi:hypothetical protein